MADADVKMEMGSPEKQAAAVASPDIPTSEDAKSEDVKPIMNRGVGEARAEKRRSCYAPIKAEFLEGEAKKEASGETKKEASGDAQSEEGGEPRQKRMRGQNKNRQKTTHKVQTARLCASLTARCPPKDAGPDDVRSCRFGERCEGIHDAGKYWAARREDLGEKCPIFDIRGWCQYGLSCRFAGAHTSQTDLEQRLDSDRWDAWKRKVRLTSVWSDEINFVSMAHLKDIRKGLYDQEDCKAWLKDRGLLFERHIKQKHKSLPPPNPVRNDAANGSGKARKDEKEEEEKETVGFHSDSDLVRLRLSERRRVDWAGKRYLAPLTTVGNLPFRRVCVELGAEVTCGEMALTTSLLQGTSSEWSLVRRHESERCFGVQIAGAHPDSLMYAAKIIAESCEVDFIDLNLGCPIDVVCQKGGGCALASRLSKLSSSVQALNAALVPRGLPLTLKFRTGLRHGVMEAEKLVNRVKEDKLAVDLMTLHGRSKEQRYTKLADWDYINKCATLASPTPFFGCGDVLSHQDYYRHLEGPHNAVAGIMVARGALIKPWLFTEIAERRDWDISSSERLRLLRRFANYGMEHWGSDEQGVEKTRRFLLEWLSFLHRYVPIGLLERLPARINEKPPPFHGRDELETLMASPRASDWVRVSELLLGPPPEGFHFVPKHKANSY